MLPLERLDVATGRRALVREVSPANRTGVLECGAATLSDHAKANAYKITRMTSELFVEEGGR